MADARTPFEFTSVVTVRGMEAKRTAKMQQQGWELVTQTPEPLLRTKLTFRRPKKKLPAYALPIAGAAVLLLAVIIAIGAATEGKTSVAATTPAASAAITSAQMPQTSSVSPAQTPTISESAQAASVPDAEVVAAFQTYFADRAKAGVVIAKTVTKVTYTNRVVTVTFDPAAAGISQATFDSINPFENLARFASTPVCFNDDVGNRLRPAIDRIETVRADGKSLGIYTAADILKENGLSK